jgi:hypothetical protein
MGLISNSLDKDRNYLSALRRALTTSIGFRPRHWVGRCRFFWVDNCERHLKRQVPSVNVGSEVVRLLASWGAALDGSMKPKASAPLFPNHHFRLPSQKSSLRHLVQKWHPEAFRISKNLTYQPPHSNSSAKNTFRRTPHRTPCSHSHTRKWKTIKPNQYRISKTPFVALKGRPGMSRTQVIGSQDYLEKQTGQRKRSTVC